MAPKNNVLPKSCSELLIRNLINDHMKTTVLILVTDQNSFTFLENLDDENEIRIGLPADYSKTYQCCWFYSLLVFQSFMIKSNFT